MQETGRDSRPRFCIAFENQRGAAKHEDDHRDNEEPCCVCVWRGVGVRLTMELAETLKRGGRLDLGDAVVKDDCVFLTKHKWFGSEGPVRCAWNEVHVWSQDGSFWIGSKSDKKAYASLSYIQVHNVHVLEHLIRFGFKKGVSRMSEVLDAYEVSSWGVSIRLRRLGVTAWQMGCVLYTFRKRFSSITRSHVARRRAR